MKSKLFVALMLASGIAHAFAPAIATYNAQTRVLTVPAIALDESHFISVRMVCDEQGLNCQVFTFDRICNGFGPERDVCGSLK